MSVHRRFKKILLFFLFVLTQKERKKSRLYSIFLILLRRLHEKLEGANFCTNHTP